MDTYLDKSSLCFVTLELDGLPLHGAAKGPLSLCLGLYTREIKVCEFQDELGYLYLLKK